MNVILDGTREVKVDHESDLLHVGQVATERVIDHEHLLWRDSGTRRCRRAELLNGLLTR